MLFVQDHLGNGLITSGAHLVELDVSDNAFGPTGVKGLKTLLNSSVCYSLKVLKINNTGLGIGGGKVTTPILHTMLTICYLYRFYQSVCWNVIKRLSIMAGNFV